MSRVPDDRSLVFLPGDLTGLLDEQGRALPRLREFVATRGNRVALFDPAVVTEAEARRVEQQVLPGLQAAYGWHAPAWPAYAWERLARAVPLGVAPPLPARLLLAESLFLRWLDAAGIAAPLVFVICAGGSDAVITRGARRITWLAGARWGTVPPSPGASREAD